MWPDWPTSFWIGLAVPVTGWLVVFGAMFVRWWRDRRTSRDVEELRRIGQALRRVRWEERSGRVA